MAFRLGELLIAKNLLSSEQLEKGLEAQRIYGGKLGTNLVELGFVTDIILANVLSEQLRLPAVTTQDFDNIPSEVIKAVPVDFVKQHKLVPVRLEPRLRVAISDPRDVEAIDELAFKTGKRVEACIAPEIWVAAAMERYYNIQRDARYIGLSKSDDFMGDEITQDVSTALDFEYAGKFETVREIMPIPKFLEMLSAAQNKEQIFESCLNFLGPIYPRMAVYVVRKDRFSGWLVRGFPVHAKEFLAVEVPFTLETPLKSMLTAKTVFQGEIMKAQAAQIGFELLQIPFGQQVQLHPIFFRGSVITILLGLAEGQVLPENRARVDMACQKAGMALELIALRKQIMVVPATA